EYIGRDKKSRYAPGACKSLLKLKAAKRYKKREKPARQYCPAKGARLILYWRGSATATTTVAHWIWRNCGASISTSSGVRARCLRPRLRSGQASRLLAGATRTNSELPQTEPRMDTSNTRDLAA